jgi:TatD DNase family protein
MPFWIDTHNHFFLNVWKGGFEAEIERALERGVGQMLLCAGGVEHFEEVRAMAHRFNCGYAAGIHPLFVRGCWEEDLKALEAFLAAHADDPHMAALGECGLDGSAPYAETLPVQEKVLAAQLKLAERFALPVSLHGRGAIDRVAKLKRARPSVRGVLHAFNGSADQARVMLSLGLKLGYGGALTYEGSRRIRKILSGLDASSFVLETDCPDMPSSARRSENPADPQSHLADIADYGYETAHLRGEGEEKVMEDAYRNTLAVFERLATLGRMRSH